MKRLLAVLAFSALAAPASAHIVLTQPQAKSGSYYVATFRVGHGCQGKATTSLSVELPPGLGTPRFRPMPGWTVAVGPRAVTWRGNLPDAAFEEFSIQVELPETTGPLYFPTTQACGAVVQRWVQRPNADGSWPDNAMPSPVVTLTP
jgi:uncharacterized protein YcnI